MSKDVVAMLFPFQPDRKVIGFHLCQGRSDSLEALDDIHLHAEKYCGGLLELEGRVDQFVVTCDTCKLTMTPDLSYDEFTRLWAKHTLQCLEPAHKGYLFHVKRPYTVRLEGDFYVGEAYRWYNWMKSKYNMVIPVQLVTSLNELTPSVYRLLSEFQATIWQRSTNIKMAVNEEVRKLENAGGWMLH